MKNKLYKCQNNETDVVLEYFGTDFKGTVLEIGANDGITLSNSYDLIKMGWDAELLEPGKTYKELLKLYEGQYGIGVRNFGIGICANGGAKLKFHESGAHVKGGNDSGLVSSSIHGEIEKWKSKGVQFTDSEIQIYNFKEFCDIAQRYKFDYISIDVEGMEPEVLSQIDLNEVGCKVLCIEWNSRNALDSMFTDYCNSFGMNETHRNAENLIFAK